MKVLLTGATGYLGRSITQALRDAGHTVVALTRDPARALLPAPNYRILRGDFRDFSAVLPALSAVNGVIHAGLAHGAEAGEIDRATVAAMLTALAGTAKPFLYTSGIWVYGDTHGRMLGEIGPFHPPARVAWRPAVEELVLQSAERGVRGMVLRPGRVYGLDGGFVQEMQASARTHGAVRIVGDGANHWSAIHVEDLADLYVRMIEEPAAGEAFVACGGMPQPVRKIALAVARSCGLEGRVESVPIEQARAELGSLADCLALDQKIGSTKAARYFGWTVRQPSVYDEIFAETAAR